MNISSIREMDYSISTCGNSTSTGTTVSRQWENDICHCAVTNNGTDAVAVDEIVLFRGTLNLPEQTRIYGESFQMLSQYVGTPGNVKCITGLSDRNHYRMPQKPDCTTLYSMVCFSEPTGQAHLIGFTSCQRFAGEFRLYDDGRFEAVLDAEGLILKPGETWQLEDMTVLSGADREKLLEKLAGYISQNHSRLPFDPIPTGWCSWYCLGPDVTEEDILDNLDAASQRFPDLRYVQIDDGYQAHMGDWLSTGPKFPSGIQSLAKAISAKGFEPAIWVAPFIAEEDSEVFQNHPDWFIADEEGNPLRSDHVTFGGWRCGPWYALDGTHPEAQEHLEMVFRTMREEWGCTYFKLDANFWGAMHGGRLHDPNATRIEAYRRGMEAVIRGAEDGFILGCNAPMWASLGLVHGMRVSGDCGRTWKQFTGVAREFLYRNWQHDRLWINDPDCTLLYGTGDSNLPENEFLFHAATILASGGMVLSGDDLRSMPEERAVLLDKLLPARGTAARFDDETFSIGRITKDDSEILILLNWTEQENVFEADVQGFSRISDFWSGESVTAESSILRRTLPARSAHVFVCS